MSFLSSNSEGASWLQQLLGLVRAGSGATPGPSDPVATLQSDLARQARLPRQGGLFGGDYARYMAAQAGAGGAAGTPVRDDAVLRRSDPQAQLFRADAARPVQMAAAQPAAAAPPLDPNKADVFQPGADGKLHPVQGWHTTGPFDVGQWAHNIDWKGVGHDLRGLALSSVMGAGADLPMTAIKALQTAARLEVVREQTLDDIKKRLGADKAR